MNRTNPALFPAAFTAWVRKPWPARPEFGAIDGKTSRRSHHRAEGAAPRHHKAGEAAAIPVLLAPAANALRFGELAENNGLRGAPVCIDAVAANAAIATAIQEAGADYLLAAKANQPTLRAKVEACFAAALPGTVAAHTDHGKGHGRIEGRTTSLVREVHWLSSDRRFPGELRRPGVACTIRVAACVERAGTTHTKTRHHVSSADLDAERAGQAVRKHWAVENWAVENSLHWVLDVTFGDDQSRLRRGHGAKNMATVRHFALTLVRAAKNKHPIKLRRKLATWTPNDLEGLLHADAKQLGFEALVREGP